MSYTPRLRDMYAGEVVPALTEKFGYKTSMKVPKLQKIIISQGIGDAVADKKIDRSRVRGSYSHRRSESCRYNI